jgi:organic radical activating enzyme
MMAGVLDVFASRQGEGICVGDPQIFVRFGGCNLVCDYCDTPESIPAKSGRQQTVEEVLTRIDALDASHVWPVSLTGGEPLLHLSFLEELITALRAQGRAIYLETNGTLPRALEKVIKGCDWVAMDFKPESATGHDLWEAHQWFLDIGANKVFVKMVLTAKTTEAEFERAVALLAPRHRSVPFLLQPATAWGEAGTIPLARLDSWWRQATAQLSDVRILPQIHRLWDIP